MIVRTMLYDGGPIPYKDWVNSQGANIVRPPKFNGYVLSQYVGHNIPVIEPWGQYCYLERCDVEMAYDSLTETLGFKHGDYTILFYRTEFQSMTSLADSPAQQWLEHIHEFRPKPS